MTNITVAKLGSLFFLANAVWQAIRLKELGFVGSVIIASVFCVGVLVMEEVEKK